LNPSDGLSIPVFVCVNKTFQGDLFQNILRRLTNTAVKRMIIVDECHHFNRTEALNLLPLSFEFRMGLSATPYEVDEPKLLDKYFDKVIFEYGVRQATDEGYLCPYYYHPILIELSKDEADQYIEVLKKISNSESSNNYLELDKILESVVAKLIKLQEILKTISSKNYSLFYCGEGYIKFENDEKLRQIDAVTSLLDKLHWRIGKITSEESKLSREGTLHNLRRQTINAIASMRILDEGIDVPDCQNAYILASQRSERQAIQRRGRILRKADSKNYAHLYDFIITGPKLSSNQLEKLYSREMKRAKLFTEDAVNFSECLDILSKV
jgi:superfamily II DNA or RNA helicase